MRRDLFVSELGAHFATHRHGFQIFARHDRAHACTSVGTVRHADDRRIAHTVLTSDARLQDLYFGVIKFSFKNILDRARVFAPKMLGGA